MSGGPDVKSVCKLTIELRWVSAEVHVEEPVVLLCGDIVEALQRLHRIGRRDFFEKVL